MYFWACRNILSRIRSDAAPTSQWGRADNRADLIWILMRVCQDAVLFNIHSAAYFIQERLPKYPEGLWISIHPWAGHPMVWIKPAVKWMLEMYVTIQSSL